MPGDPTPPNVTPIISGTLGLSGWYTSNVTVNWSVTDPESIILSTTGCNAVTLSTDTVGTPLACSAESDGGTTSVSRTFKVDKTAPAVTATSARAANATGWYTAPIDVSFAGSDLIAGVASCSAAKTYVGPDTAAAEVTGTCTDGAGNVGSKSLALKYDATAPQVTASPSRPAGADGWYSSPLTVTFTGGDATSGIAGCESVRYAGPDNPGASANGTCKDVAGNTATGSFPFKYDATAPSLFAVSAKLGNRSAQLTWRKSSDTTLVEVVRAPGRSSQGETVVYRGSETGFVDSGLVVGRKYEYRVAGIDEAANRTETKLGITATGALLSPAPGARVTAPPTLVWTPRKGASYYNVQLMRGGKVFSAWPTRPSLRLRRTWTYEGRRYRLRPGVYRWYVWPGRGRIGAARYGRLLGSSTFVVSG